MPTHIRKHIQSVIVKTHLFTKMVHFIMKSKIKSCLSTSIVVLTTLTILMALTRKNANQQQADSTPQNLLRDRKLARSTHSGPGKAGPEFCSTLSPFDNAARNLFLHATTARPSSYPYITGDTIRAFADHVFDETTDVSAWSHKAFDIEAGDVVFLKTDFMDEFFTSTFPRIKNGFVLATHNSDFPAPSQYASFLDDARLLAWYALNPDTVHPKLVPVPISLANAYWPHGRPSVVQDAFDAKKEAWSTRQHGLYINMDITSNKDDRPKALTSVARLESVYVRRERLNYSDYLHDVANSKFVLSPPGNGADCHRTWEAILLNAVPIVVSSSLLSPLYKGLPVMTVDDWSEVTEAKLQQFAPPTDRHCVPDVLRADHWFGRMLSHKQRSVLQGSSEPQHTLQPVFMRPNVADGQVRLDTEFGLLLFQLSSRPDVNRVLEIGTWKGGGSSLCIARGLNMHRHAGTEFVTVETNADRHAIASDTLSNFQFVKCLHGTAVDHKMVSTHDDVQRFYQQHPRMLLPRWQKYRAEEEEESGLFAGQQPILDRYCGKDPPFDLVFLDGGEFYGRAEFLEVLSKCKPRLLALHDVGSFKNYDARATLLRASKSGAANAYKLVRENTEGAGYAVFERV